MDKGSFLIVVLNFTYIGLLPVVFFKRSGKLNLMWWLTATPFLVSVGSVIASFAGLLLPVVPFGKSLPGLQMLAVPLSLSSIALISFTLGTHRIPIALWHQTNDAPEHIVTWGAYGKIRHPFYAAFLLAFIAALLYSPQAFTLAGLLCGTLVLNATAAREERRLAASEFGGEYQRYMERTGRFVPRRGVKA